MKSGRSAPRGPRPPRPPLTLCGRPGGGVKSASSVSPVRPACHRRADRRTHQPTRRRDDEDLRRNQTETVFEQRSTATVLRFPPCSAVRQAALERSLGDFTSHPGLPHRCSKRRVAPTTTQEDQTCVRTDCDRTGKRPARENLNIGLNPSQAGGIPPTTRHATEPRKLVR